MFDCLKSPGSTKFRDSSLGICVLLTQLFFLVAGVLSVSAQETELPNSPIVEEDPETAVPTDEAVETPAGEELIPSPVEEPVDSAAALSVIEQVNLELRGENAVGDEGAAGSPLAAEGERTVVDAFIRMIGGLSIVLFIILVIFYLVRRFGKNVPALAGSRLGQVIGQVHLSRDVTLHYVRTGGRVLVIGVNPTGVNLVAEFGASTFDGGLDESDIEGSFNSDAFVSELKGQTDIYTKESGEDVSESSSDDDMAILRSDIHRLQEYLREESRESKD
jgi:flagellar biogenesis protein FliO